MMTDGQLSAIDGRMRNWGDWARLGPSYARGRCGSAEGLYVPPPADEQRQEIQVRRQLIDTHDAEIVEKAVCGLRYIPARDFVIKWYVRGMPKGQLARLFRLDLELVEPFRVRSLGMVREQLDQPQVVLIRKGQPLWAGVARTTRGRV